jgi:hypothetical protein
MAFRRTAFERHSSWSLNRLSTISHSAWIPLSRLTELAEQILFECHVALPEPALYPELLALHP